MALMKFSINQKYRPYSHLPGTRMVLPGSGEEVEIYPTLIKLIGINEDVSLNIRGPINQFTVCNDLEKQQIIVWGVINDKWFRYLLVGGNGQKIRLIIERSIEGVFSFEYRAQTHSLTGGDFFDFGSSEVEFFPYPLFQGERLFLGNHKKQAWDQIKQRKDLTEIFPIWHRLGQLIPPQLPTNEIGGTFELLRECQQSINDRSPELAIDKWINLFCAGFRGLLAPRSIDDEYLGLVRSPLTNSDCSPLVLLTEGALLIRSLFVKEDLGVITILPYLLPIFHCGSFVNVLLKSGEISIEWTKKTIRRLIFKAAEDQELAFVFRSDVRSFRLRSTTNSKGKEQSSKDLLKVIKNHYYYFDNFR